jgi:hypothetical protein
VSITPGNRNLMIFQGAMYSKTFTWTNDDDSPVDLTGYTAWLQVRPHSGSETVFLEMSTDDDTITLGDEAGTITLELDAEATSELDFTWGHYDLLLTSPEGATRLIQASCRLSPAITREAAGAS